MIQDLQSKLEKATEALKVYAGLKPSWAVWDTEKYAFITFDDFGGTCAEAWGPYHALNALKDIRGEK
jgi:hypothetical protein